MDEVARGIATAALTLQSSLLHALVAYGAMSPEQALEVVDLAVEVSMRNGASKAEEDEVMVTIQALEEIREGLANMAK
jgi:hypothetical protein